MSNAAVTAVPDAASLPTGCTTVNQQVVCSAGADVAAEETFSFYFPFTIAPSTLPGTWPDCGREPDASCVGAPPGGWAEVSTSTNETDLTNNYDTAGLVVATPQADLKMTKTALSTIPNPNETASGADPALPHPAYIAGAKFGYRIDLWIPATWDEDEDFNVLWADATNVVLTDALPEGFLATQVNPGQGTCAIADPATSIRCDLGTIAASADHLKPQKVSVYVYGSIDPGTVAEMSDPDGGALNTATATTDTANAENKDDPVVATANTDVIEQGDLEVRKAADAAVSYAGNTVGYTITTLNNGPSAAPNTVITDTLPPGLSLDPAGSPGCKVASTQGSGPSASQVIECVPQVGGEAAGVIPPNQSVNTRIVATTNPRDLRDISALPPDNLLSEHPRDLLNSVEVSSDAIDTDESNNKAAVNTELATLADIQVAASVTTDTPSAGTDITYTLTGSNLGPSTFDNPVVVSTFPAGFEVTSVESTMDCLTDHTGAGLAAVYTVTCTGKQTGDSPDSLLPGITVTGNVTVHIPDDMPVGSYDATAVAYSKIPGVPNPCPSQAAGTCEANYNNNTASVTVSVVESADTSLTKTLVGPDPLVAGSEVVYELEAANAGPSIAADLVVADAVPDGLTYLSGEVVGGSACPTPEEVDPNPGGTEGEGDGAIGQQKVVKCEVGQLAPGARATVRLTFRVDPHYQGELCNKALVGSGALDPNSSNNQAEACGDTELPPTTDVGVTAAADNANVGPAAPVGYTVVVSNNTQWATTGASVTLSLPAALASPKVEVTASSGGAQPAACAAGAANQYTCQIGDFLGGATVTYRVTGTSPVAIAPPDLVLQAKSTHDRVPDTNPGNDQAQATVKVAAQTADLSLTKIHSGTGAPVAGGQVAYDLVASNAGPFAASGVVVSDTVPAGLIYVSGQVVGGASCAPPAAGLVRCQVGDLAKDATATVKLVFDVDLDFRGEICNTGEVASDVQDLGPNPNSAQVCGQVTVPGPTDVGVTAAADQANVDAGDPVGYTVVVTNNGGSPTTGAQVVLQVPAGLKSPSVVVASSTPGADPAACVAGADGAYTCAIGDFLVGASVRYRVTGTAALAIVQQNLVLEAESSHDGEDLDPSNNQARAEVLVAGETADLSLVKKAAGSGSLMAGQQVVYNLVVSNAGPHIATGVVVGDKVPAGLAYVSGQVLGAASGGGACALAGGVVSCAVGNLADGASATVQLVFGIDLGFKGTLSNTGTVGSDVPDPNPDDNTSTTDGDVKPPVTDVGVTVTADSAEVKAGQPVGYTAVVTNNGPVATTGTRVVFTAPPRLGSVSVVATDSAGGASAGACQANGNVYSCEIGLLPVGATVTYRITGTAPAGATAADLALVAHVTHDDADTDPSNDTAEAVVHVDGKALEFNGSNSTGPLLLAATMVLLGSALLAARRRLRA
ncbi:MAG: DUF11 domain-containing protein [Bifidobacteriaceae bacterium]|jgi:uncharacterized repeat protein (TIGR01451 family)|nr:DUF11 domain-containing protein [Bifidobacteriaceae bacterium]